MSDLPDQQFERAVERILGNSRLTADLNDEAAQILLGWGIDQAKEILSESAELDNIGPSLSQEERLQATQRMMRLINDWVSGRTKRESQENSAYLERIIAEAERVYDQSFALKSETQRASFMHAHLGKDQPEVLISELRTFLETGL